MSRLSRAVVSACLVALAVVAPAAAGRPTTERVPIADTGIHDDGISAACGFDVWFDGAGHITFRLFTDADGDPVREVNNYAIRIRYYSEFGEVSTIDVGPDRVTYLDDGSLIVAITGNLQSLTAPGEGRVSSQNGWVKIHVTFDEDGNPTEELISEAGLHTDEDETEILCGLLAPAD